MGRFIDYQARLPVKSVGYSVLIFLHMCLVCIGNEQAGLMLNRRARRFYIGIEEVLNLML